MALSDLARAGWRGRSRALLQELNFPRVIVVPDLAAIASLWVTARDLAGGSAARLVSGWRSRRICCCGGIWR